MSHINLPGEIGVREVRLNVLLVHTGIRFGVRTITWRSMLPSALDSMFFSLAKIQDGNVDSIFGSRDSDN